MAGPGSQCVEVTDLHAPLLNAGELVEAGDSLVRRKSPLATPTDIERYGAALVDRRGSRNLRFSRDSTYNLRMIYGDQRTR